MGISTNILDKEDEYEFVIEEYIPLVSKPNYRYGIHSHDCRLCEFFKSELTNPYWYANPHTGHRIYIQPNIRFWCRADKYNAPIRTVHRKDCRRFKASKQKTFDEILEEFKKWLEKPKE